MLILLEDQWTRTDECHLTKDDIDQLRNLVERMTSQEPASARHARIVEDLEHPRVSVMHRVHVQMRHVLFPGVRVHCHRAELDDPELLPVSAHPELAEEHRAWRVELDPNR